MALPITIIEKENLLKSFPMERLQQEMAQPTGNFPLYLVMSRIKEVESIMASQRADAAERQMSNQAGSVYERMLQGQQDTGMGLNAGMPNVMSEVAATPDASMQGMTPPALAEGLKSVAAHGGYVNNLPTVRMAGKDESRTSRSREAMNWMKRETPGQGVVPDPFLNFEALGLGSGLAALGGGTLFNMLRKRGQSAKDFMPRETADMQEEQRQVKDLKRERDLDEVRETGWMYAPHRLLDRLRGGDTVEQPSPEFSSVSDLNESQYATFIKAFPDWRTIFGGRPQERNAQQEHLLHNTITAVRSNKNWTPEELREMARVGAAPDTSGMEEGLGYIPETGKLLEVREKSQGGMAGFPTVRMQGVEIPSHIRAALAQAMEGSADIKNRGNREANQERLRAMALREALEKEKAATQVPVDSRLRRPVDPGIFARPDSEWSAAHPALPLTGRGMMVKPDLSNVLPLADIKKQYGGLAGLPTVRMAGDPRDTMPMSERDIVRVAAAAEKAGMPTGGSFEEGGAMGGYNASKQGLVALMAARARHARELAAQGMPLVGRYGKTSPYGTGSGFVKSYGETAVASNGGYARDLPTVRMQGMEVDPFAHYPDRDLEYLPEGPDWGPIRKGVGWTLDKAGQLIRSIAESHQPTDFAEGSEGELRTQQTVVQPSDASLSEELPAISEVAAPDLNIPPIRSLEDDLPRITESVSSVPEQYSELPPPEPSPPSRIVVDNATIDSASDARKKLDAAVDQQGTTFSALENIQGMQTAEEIAQGKKDLITTLGVPATEYDTAVEGHVSNIKEASDTAISTIKEKMDAYTNFAKGGKLPEEVRGRFITDLLLLGSKALLGNPTWHQAGEQFVDDAMKVKKEYREDWAKSLNVMLTNESNIQQMKVAATTAEETARISLARSKYEAATGAITAASQYEKDAYAANNERTRLELALSTANAQNITALATYVAATEGKPDPEERQIKNIIEARFRELNEAGDTSAMDKEFYSINGKYSAANIRIDKWVPIINEYRLTGRGPSPYTGMSYERTNRDAYDAAVTIAKKAYGKVQGEGSFDGAEEAIDIVTAMGIDINDPQAMEKIDKDAFIAAYIREMNPTQVQGEWAQFYMPEYGMTTGGWTAKLPPKNNGTE
jgi:hypothetical protein